MIRINFNNGAPLRINLPRVKYKQDILDLAQTFVAYETTRLEADRTPFTARIETALTTALAAQDTAQDQEAARKTASEALKRTDRTAKQTLRQMRSLLAGHFAATPEQAQAWGFFVRQTGRSAGQILMPQSRPEMIACLNEYIDAETARPEAEQFPNPPLAEVIAVRDALVQQRQSRNSARQSRLEENGRLETLSNQLFEDLRRALGYLMLVTFDSEPNRNLAQWGFEVVSRSPRPARDEAEPEPAPPVEETVLEPV